MKDSEGYSSESRWTPEHKRLFTVAGVGTLIALGVGALTGWRVDAYFKEKEIKDATAEAYLKGLGFDEHKVPIEVLDGAAIVRIGCETTETDLDTVVKPYVALNLDDKGSANIVRAATTDAEGVEYGTETVIVFPLGNSQEVESFIMSDLVELCETQN